MLNSERFQFQVGNVPVFLFVPKPPMKGEVSREMSCKSCNTASNPRDGGVRSSPRTTSDSEAPLRHRIFTLFC